jgi:hypothetical protein
MAKIGVHLWRSAGQIQCANAIFLYKSQNQVNNVLVHQFRSCGACIDMAMGTTQVAQVTKIDLEGIELQTIEWRKTGFE